MHWGLYLKGQSVFVPLHSVIARGNPPAPQYSPGHFPPPVILKYAGVKSFSAFARSALTCAINQNDGVFEIEGYRKDRKGYWEQDPGQKIVFPSGTTLDTVIDRMIAILEDAAQKRVTK